MKSRYIVKSDTQLRYFDSYIDALDYHYILIKLGFNSKLQKI